MFLKTFTRTCRPLRFLTALTTLSSLTHIQQVHSFSQRMATFSVTRSNSPTTSTPTVTVAPKNEAEQSGLVVISHGLGDTCDGFADIAENLAGQMPHLKFILPTAPTQPVTLNGGMAMPSWYDITGLDERSNEECEGIEQSRETILDILKKEHEETKLPYNRMVLMGFSQGGALSLFTGFQLEPEQKLAGLVVLSAYLPAQKKFSMTNGLEDTSVLHCHGEADPMIALAKAKKSRTIITGMGATKYEFKSYAGLLHSVNMEEIGDVAKFLNEVLPNDDTCRVTLKDPSDMSVKELKAAIRSAGLGSKAVGLIEKKEFVKLVTDHRDGKL